MGNIWFGRRIVMTVYNENFDVNAFMGLVLWCLWGQAVRRRWFAMFGSRCLQTWSM